MINLTHNLLACREAPSSFTNLLCPATMLCCVILLQTGGDLEAIRDVDLSKLDASAMDTTNIDADGSEEDDDSDSDDDR